MTIKAAFYLRVSTDTQETANQRPDLERECGRYGHEVVVVYEEAASAWEAGHQAELRRAYQDARRGKFQVLWVWALDRLSREGPAAMLAVVKRFASVGVQVVSVQEQWTHTSGPTTELLMALAGWVAQMESQRHSERVKAGMVRAAKTGTESGKAIGRPVGRRDSHKRRPKRMRSVAVSGW